MKKDSSNKPFLMSVGNSTESIYCINVAKSLGYNVVAVGHQLVDYLEDVEQIKVDIRDQEATLNVAREYNIKAILPSPIGRYISTVGYINETLDLIGPTAYSTFVSSDKLILNNILSINTMYNITKQINSITPNLSTHLKLFNFPIIAKPRYGAGSKSVKTLYSISETIEYITTYQDNNSGELIIEELITDYIDNNVPDNNLTANNLKGSIDEFGIDLIVINYEISFINIREKVLTSFPYRQELGYISFANIDKKQIDIIKDYMQNIINKLVIKNSIVHADLIFNSSNKKPYLIEISPRPAGLNITSQLIQLATKRDIISDFIRYQLGENICFTDIKQHQFSLIQYIDIENITIKQDLDITRLINRFNKNKVDINIKKDMIFEKIKNSRDILARGYYIITDKNYDTLKERNREILDYIKEIIL